MSNHPHNDSEILKLTAYQFLLISYAIEFQKDKNNNNNDTVAASTDWHDAISQDVRHHLIDKQVETIQSSVYQNTRENFSADTLIDFMKLYEERFFRKATSKIDYYRYMAYGMYYHVQRLKLDREQRNQSSAASSSSDTCLHQSNMLDQDQVDVVDLTDVHQQVSIIIYSFMTNQNKTCKILMTILAYFIAGG